jgi:hypothetical protein
MAAPSIFNCAPYWGAASLTKTCVTGCKKQLFFMTLARVGKQLSSHATASF